MSVYTNCSVVAQGTVIPAGNPLAHPSLVIRQECQLFHNHEVFIARKAPLIVGGNTEPTKLSKSSIY